MTRDKEVNLGEIDSVSVDDGRRGGQPSRRLQPARPGAEKGTDTSAGAPRVKKKPTQNPAGGVANKQGAGVWVLTTIMLAVVMVILGAYFFRELSQMRLQLDATLDQSTQKLGNLESQLSATDESLNQSSDKTSDMLASHDAEIRKLWDISNKRNKDLIQKNKVAISKLESSRSSLTKKLADVEAAMAALNQQNSQYALQRNQMQTQLDLASEAVKQAEVQVAAQKKVIEPLNKILPELKTVAAEQAKGEGLVARLGEIEAAIAAFDAYRRQLNTRLGTMESSSK